MEETAKNDGQGLRILLLKNCRDVEKLLKNAIYIYVYFLLQGTGQNYGYRHAWRALCLSCFGENGFRLSLEIDVADIRQSNQINGNICQFLPHFIHFFLADAVNRIVVATPLKQFREL